MNNNLDPNEKAAEEVKEQPAKDAMLEDANEMADEKALAATESAEEGGTEG